MRSNYKRLGDYIEPCNEKNTGNLIKELRGISNQKFFQKAKTNTIGIDLSKYRVVRTGQFAFNRATTRNGDKISIALRQGEDCIVSPSYRMFKSKDENVLNSEYLMMWFRRPEFDRYARFKSHGSAHEFFDLDEMYEVELPVPSIENQREIVREYNTIVNRIKLNKEIIVKLNHTLDIFFKEFVKGSSDEQKGSIMDFLESANTGLDAIKRAPIVRQNTGRKCLRIQDVSRDKGYDAWGFTNVEDKNFIKFQLKKDDIIIARTGATVGSHMLIKKNLNSVFNNGLIRVRADRSKVFPSILYALFSTKSFKEHVDSIAFGTSTQPNVKIGDLFSHEVSFPPVEEQTKIINQFNALNNSILSNREQISALLKMQQVLLARMAKIERLENLQTT